MHRHLKITDEQRKRFVALYMEALDEAGMPGDEPFRQAVHEHVEFGAFGGPRGARFADAFQGVWPQKREKRQSVAKRDALADSLLGKNRYLQELFEADAGTRTPDPFITSEVLYQLSYVGVICGDRVLSIAALAC